MFQSNETSVAVVDVVLGEMVMTALSVAKGKLVVLRMQLNQYARELGLASRAKEDTTEIEQLIKGIQAEITAQQERVVALEDQFSQAGTAQGSSAQAALPRDFEVLSDDGQSNFTIKHL